MRPSRESAISSVPIDLLNFADTPRLAGENPEHIRVLAESDAELPPILVHRETMTVIDGMHRLRAAMLNGRREIKAEFFDGTRSEAFIAAVRANIGYGMPLSLADREAATIRILGSHPRWSDRAIAEVVGLAARTVAKLRAESTAEEAQAKTRIGRDGRERPINSAAGRRLAGQLFAERPEASLREIAQLAGISPATAHDVRDRLRSGEDPVPAKQLMAEQRRRTVASETTRMGRVHARRAISDPEAALRKLSRDPSLRHTEMGRGLLRLLTACRLKPQDWEEMQHNMPAHCIALVADLALSYADEWAKFGEALKDRARGELA